MGLDSKDHRMKNDGDEWLESIQCLVNRNDVHKYSITNLYHRRSSIEKNG